MTKPSSLHAKGARRQINDTDPKPLDPVPGRIVSLYYLDEVAR